MSSEREGMRGQNERAELLTELGFSRSPLFTGKLCLFGISQQHSTTAAAAQQELQISQVRHNKSSDFGRKNRATSGALFSHTASCPDFSFAYPWNHLLGFQLKELDCHTLPLALQAATPSKETETSILFK